MMRPKVPVTHKKAKIISNTPTSFKKEYVPPMPNHFSAKSKLPVKSFTRFVFAISPTPPANKSIDQIIFPSMWKF